MPASLGVFDLPTYVFAIMVISVVVLYGLSYVMTVFDIVLPALISLALAVIGVLVVLVTYWTTPGVWAFSETEGWGAVTFAVSLVTIVFCVRTADKIIDVCYEKLSKTSS